MRKRDKTAPSHEAWMARLRLLWGATRKTIRSPVSTAFGGHGPRQWSGLHPVPGRSPDASASDAEGHVTRGRRSGRRPGGPSSATRAPGRPAAAHAPV